MNRFGERIALVEDEEPVRMALGRLLRSAGYLVEAYASGAEFLAALELGPPACVVLDLRMPDVDGHEVQARLADGWPAVPVVVVTGCGAPERERARRAGALAVLGKPVDESDLLAAVGSAVSAG